MNEIFKKSTIVPHFMVSNMGRVINTETGKIFEGRINKTTGYREVVAYLNGKRKDLLVHRLVAEEFCEKPDDGQVYEVNHINGIREDERAVNLEWVTHAENLHYQFVLGNRDYDVAPKKVVATNMETGEQMTFPSIYKAARFFNISQGNICMCCKGVRPYANGYYWDYAQEDEDETDN